MAEPSPSLSALVVQFDPQAAELVHQLAHELRQPLSAIEAIAYYLRIVLPHVDPRTRQQVDKLDLLAEQMNWILSDALHYFRAVTPHPQLLDLHELVSEALVERGSADGPRFHADIPATPALVSLDAAQARHLLRSLIALFRQLAPPAGEVRIYSRVDETTVSLEFLAPGLTFSPEELYRWFEPFNPRMPAGSGMALASARRIVEAHGGRITARSDPATGTSIENAFPLAG